MEITVLTLLNKDTNETDVQFHSASCSSMESSELWVGTDSNKFLVIHSAAYYDDNLKERRNNMNMLSTWKPIERLTLVGQVWGGSQNITDKKIILGQSFIEAAVYGT